MLKNILFLSTAIFSSQVLAQSPAVCPAPLEPAAQTVKSLIGRASSMRTMDDFLGALPQTITSNFIFVADSRSFQNGTKEAPRVVMTSPNGDVRLSFNNDPSQRGYNNIEISMWNPETRSYEYQELVFNREGASSPRHNNGLACTMCHGEPQRANWDPTNLPGAIPYDRDTLRPGTAELGWYTNLIRKTQDQNPANRLRHLKPIESADQLASLSGSENYTRKVMTDAGPQRLPSGGVSTRLVEKVQERQRCAGQKQIEENPGFEKFKFLLAGLQSGCEMNNFVPEWFEENARDYFYGAGVSSVRQDQRPYEAVLADTRTRQKNYQKMLLERQLQFIQDNAGKQSYSVERQGDDSEAVARFRYFMEPFGVQVAALSTAADPGSYLFGGTFKPEYLSAEKYQALVNQAGGKNDRLCRNLARLSQQALSDPALQQSLLLANGQLCEQREARDRAVDSFSKSLESVMQYQAQEVFGKKCAACHTAQQSNGLTVSGAPAFPFRNMTQLREQILNPTGLVSNLGGRIIDRMGRPHGSPGAMPMMGLTKVDDSEVAIVRAWIQSIARP